VNSVLDFTVHDFQNISNVTGALSRSLSCCRLSCANALPQKNRIFEIGVLRTEGTGDLYAAARFGEFLLQTAERWRSDRGITQEKYRGLSNSNRGILMKDRRYRSRPWDVFR
jgi:hypothetical protein